MKRIVSVLLLSTALFLGGCKTETKQESRETVQEMQHDSNVKAEDFDFSDRGPGFFTINIEDFTSANTNFRSTVWTGEQMQMTLMSIPVGGEIGEEIHTTVEQFIRVEEGEGEIYIGETQESMKAVQKIKEDEIVFIPLNVWHNIKNTGDKPLKLYSIYAPGEHARGTIHVTMEEGQAHDHDH